MKQAQLLSDIALSLLSSRVVKNHMADFYDGVPSEEILQRLDEKSRGSIMPHIASVYTGDIFEIAESIINRSAKEKVEVISYNGENYPPLLKEINKPPVILYLKGNINSLTGNCLAMVGARKPVDYFYTITEKMAAHLAKRDITIVSGMALGIDRASHVGALSTGGGTIGVLANGFGIVYPRENMDIYKNIIASDRSALVTEYPPGVVAGKWTFVQRNRIISGLSPATLLVQAAEKSGALITARYALEEGRDVFACTGNSFDERFSGCHRLIREGATPVFAISDIVDNLPRSFNQKDRDRVQNNPAGRDNTHRGDSNGLSALPVDKIHRGGTRDGEMPGGKKLDLSKYPYGADSLEMKIIHNLKDSSRDIDDLIRTMDEKTSLVNEKIILLELDGYIRKKGSEVTLI